MTLRIRQILIGAALIATISIGKATAAPNVHVALACQYTNHAAAIYRATYFKLLLESSPDHGDVDAANHIRLKDDGTLFTETVPQGVAEILDLNSKAKSEWKQAEQDSTTPQSQAQTYYYEAWSSYIFTKMRPEGEEDKSVAEVLPLKQLPNIDVSLGLIGKSTSLNANNPIYWQADGDFNHGQDTPFYSTVDVLGGKSVTASARNLYIKSLVLDPTTESLWLQLAYMDNTSAEDLKSDLIGATTADPNDGFPLLFYAGLLLKGSAYNKNSLNADYSDTPTQQERDVTNAAMIASITPADVKIGNQVEQMMTQAAGSGVFTTVADASSVPPELSDGLSYVTMSFISDDFPYFAKLRAAARDVCGLAIAEAYNGNIIEADTLLKNLSKTVAPVVAISPQEAATTTSVAPTTIMICQAVDAIALHERSQLCDKFGSPAEASLADADSNAEKANTTA